ncbi:ATPase [Aureococcus anophagefferens]|nr:ATPase [Aureococcus anophagefferens]
MPSDGPKHGAWDDEAHMGGNMFAGGSGGSGTAGLGGRGGPYRLDVGQQLGHMTQQEKDAVDDASLAAAKDMATKAHAKKLEELGFGPAEASAYEAARDAVLLGATELRAALLDREKRDRERVWKTRQTVGELDDNLLVDGHGETRDPIRLRFVFDCSGSMYTFNRIDRRLERLQQIALFVFEALDGLDDDYDYSVVAHSQRPEAELFVPWGGRKPKSPKERWASRSRLDGTAAAIRDVAKGRADERFVFLISDADLKRYGIDAANWNAIIMKDPKVQAFVLLISSNDDEAAEIQAKIHPGRAVTCFDTANLPTAFREIFAARVLKLS